MIGKTYWSHFFTAVLPIIRDLGIAHCNIRESRRRMLGMTTPRPKAISLIEQKLLSMLGDRWPIGTRLPPTNILALWLRTGQRNMHQAVKELTRKGYLESRPRAGTSVVRGPEVANSHVRRGSKGARRRPVAGLRVAIVRNGRGEPPPVQRIIESRLSSAGLLVEEILHKDGFSCDLTRYSRPDLAGMVLLFPELYSSVRFDERTSLAVLASSRVIDIDATAGFDYVSVDEVQASIMVGRRARELGATRPCFVGSDLPVTDGEYDETSTLRMRAFEDGLGRRIPGRYQIHAGRYEAGSGQRASVQLLKLDPMPDFVFAVSDDVAIGLMAGTAVHDVIAGRDYMLIGFDGGAPGKAVAGGPLSSVERPEEAMAHLTSSLLLDRLAFPDHSTRRMQIGCTLVEGSTARLIGHDLAAAPLKTSPKR
jgi:hypothetical protein